jgi:hypothetical protein
MLKHKSTLIFTNPRVPTTLNAELEQTHQTIRPGDIGGRQNIALSTKDVRTMQNILSPILAVLFTGPVAPACLAERSLISTGHWPRAWPAELDNIRPQSRTLNGVVDFQSYSSSGDYH